VLPRSMSKKEASQKNVTKEERNPDQRVEGGRGNIVRKKSLTLIKKTGRPKRKKWGIKKERRGGKNFKDKGLLRREEVLYLQLPP